jgi:hypothetical protein
MHTKAQRHGLEVKMRGNRRFVHKICVAASTVRSYGTKIP